MAHFQQEAYSNELEIHMNLSFQTVNISTMHSCDIGVQVFHYIFCFLFVFFFSSLHFLLSMAESRFTRAHWLFVANHKMKPVFEWI